MTKIILALILVLGLTAAQEFSPMPGPVTAREPNFGIYAAEAGGAILGGFALGYPTALASVYLFNQGGDMGPTLTRAMIVGLPFGVVGLAVGTTLVGGLFHQQGRFWPTLAWSAGAVAGGLALAAGGMSLGNNDVGPLGQLAPVVVAIGLVAPPILTTIGYNRSRPQKTISGRFLPGSVALGSVRDADGVAHPSLDLRLISVRL